MAEYTVSNYPRDNLSSKATAMLDKLARNPATANIPINSGYRSPSHNKKVGGAKKSQHTHGNAVDLGLGGLSDAAKKAVLDAAIAAGAKGLGVYKSGTSLHIDPRKNLTIWGQLPDKYKGMTTKQFGLLPGWARPSISNLFSGKTLNSSASFSLPSSAPIPQSRPSAPLTPFAAAPVGRVERMALPSISPPAPQPAVAQAKQLAAYQQYGASRAAAPAVPTTPVDPKIANAYAQYAQSRMAAPTTPLPSLQMPPAPVMPTPPAVRLQPVPAPVMAPVQESYPAAPQRPSLTAGDIYGGAVGSAYDSSGQNLVSGDALGRTSVANQYGATTVTGPNGNQAASWGSPGIDGPLGGMSASHGISLPSIPGGKVGQFAKSGLGTVGGAAIGSLGGPVGSILGALIGRELAKPGAGAIGGFLNGSKNVNTSQIGSVLGMNFGPTTAFAKPQGGLAFPDAPVGGFRDSRFSNRSYEGMRDISPKAAKDISKGKAGLF